MDTIRQTMALILARGPATCRQLAEELELTPAEAQGHLAHLARSRRGSLVMEPARCRACGHVFKGRARLDPPGRCPQCRGQRIDGPWFSLPDGDGR